MPIYNPTTSTGSGGNGITDLSGDITATGPGSATATLATVNGNVGTFGSATQSVSITVNGKGLVTAISNVTVTPAVGSITGLGTGVATFLATPSSANLASAITDETGTGKLVFATSPTLITPALGTPASGVMTNVTGLPAAAILAGTLGAGTYRIPSSGSDYIQFVPSDGGGFPSMEMFNAGITQAFLTAGTDTLLAAPAFLMSVGLVVTGNLRATGKFQISATIASAPTVWSPANAAAGVLELASVVGTPNFISFNEQGIAFLGTLGFPAGSSDLVYYSGGTGTWATGTETWRLTNGGNMSVIGKVVKYNNISTAGWGMPAIYGSGRSTAQTAAVASVATYTVGAADGSFLVSANANITAFVAGTFNVTVAYTDETNTARTLTLNFSSLTGTLGVALAATGPFEGIPAHIRCKASTAITIATTGTFTSLTYNVEGVITQIT